MTLIIALSIGLIVSIPWFLASRFKGGTKIFIVTFLVSAFLVYFTTPTTAGPFFGHVGLIAAVGLVLSGILSVFDAENHKERIPGYLAIPVVLAYVITAFFNSPMTRATTYAALVPSIKQRDWSKDFQPKDPRHFRVSSPENALFLARRAIGQATTLDSRGQPNAIGSQFTIREARSSVQIIGKELWTIVPLDWTSYGPQYSGTIGVPGYIKVSAENPILPAEYVSLPAGKEFKYTPEAVFSHNLERLVWKHHMDKYVADIHLEIDDENVPHYIVSLAEPTIGWWGEKVVGALIVDPTTGAGVEQFIPLGKMPTWVDRVEAEYIVHRNIDYHSKYAGGFINRSIYGSSVLAATQTHFGYGSDGQPVFATGITAHNNNNKSDSLIAVYYTNTRTGETVEYVLQGGATEEKAIEQCNLLGDVKNKSYHGTTPQLYNVYGHISYVVPLQNQTHAFAGVAIVSVMNPQIIAWGQNAHEAELAYKQVIVANSSQMAIDGTRKLSTTTNIVARISSATVSGSTTYFILLKGMDHLLTVPMSTSAKVPVTQPGDTVVVEYYDSGETIMPVNKFDNKSIQLARSEIQTDVQTRAEAGIDRSRAKANEASDIQGIMEKLTPDQKRLLQDKLKK
ncbi:MAG: hypothetical protein JWO73_955 [Candidatus Taylorbacteria bacterium]|nr:hypothetical protein [Candidatus Taylorbacteria bacterium]